MLWFRSYNSLKSVLNFTVLEQKIDLKNPKTPRTAGFNQKSLGGSAEIFWEVPSPIPSTSSPDRAGTGDDTPELRLRIPFSASGIFPAKLDNSSFFIIMYYAGLYKPDDFDSKTNHLLGL